MEVMSGCIWISGGSWKRSGLGNIRVNGRSGVGYLTKSDRMRHWGCAVQPKYIVDRTGCTPGPPKTWNIVGWKVGGYSATGSSVGKAKGSLSRAHCEAGPLG